MRAYFTEGAAIGDMETLARLASEVGVDPSGLTGEAFADTVHADEELAARIGIRGVPYFVLDRRYGVSGAQPSELLLQALEKAWEARADAA
jgi:predicted DsbA family dithiol-disulfide isomerase